MNMVAQTLLGFFSDVNKIRIAVESIAKDFHSLIEWLPDPNAIDGVVPKHDPPKPQ